MKTPIETVDDLETRIYASRPLGVSANELLAIIDDLRTLAAIESADCSCAGIDTTRVALAYRNRDLAGKVAALERREAKLAKALERMWEWQRGVQELLPDGLANDVTRLLAARKEPS